MHDFDTAFSFPCAATSHGQVCSDGFKFLLTSNPPLYNTLILLFRLSLLSPN